MGTLKIKNKMKKGDLVKLQKISDDEFEGKHPNQIYRNHTVYGEIYKDLEVGAPLYLNGVTGDSHGFFYTSTVKEIIDENTFKTKNSTYRIEVIDSKPENDNFFRT